MYLFTYRRIDTFIFADIIIFCLMYISYTYYNLLQYLFVDIFIVIYILYICLFIYLFYYVHICIHASLQVWFKSN